MRFRLDVNGSDHEVDVPAAASLLCVIRDDLGLTGTKYGCGLGACGACYVLLDGDAVPACTLTVAEAAGRTIVTVEGLASGDTLHPLQRAFVEADAMQCGFCTAGMLISAAALLARKPRPTEADIRAALDPHLCRCGVYGRAIRAVLEAAS
jgi:aerobic-type carbon monoxide dehydrogenase small subunit (CoxS/CutS family)